jgi:DNA-binding transcriptional LysR family regulator
MPTPDLNLLFTLDVLLQEGSVAGAARRLRLSASAMSRALARLRETTGDPLLVRAGRGLVPTPRALALREQVRRLVQDSVEVLQPAEVLNLQQLQRTFTLRNREGFVENFGAALVERVAAQAPGVRLRFEQKTERDNAALREGLADLETGVVGPALAPELRVQALFSDRFVSVVRQGHPLAGQLHELPPYVAGRHIGVAHRTGGQEGVDLALERLGLRRQVDLSVGSFSAALALARATDCIANVPERHTHSLREGMHSAALPVPVPAFSVSLIWHPRNSADPAHRWLRHCVREVVLDRLARMSVLDGGLPGLSGADGMSMGAGGAASEGKMHP